MMTELVHVTARIEASDRNGLKEMAKRRMMATGEACTLAELIREAIAQYVARDRQPAKVIEEEQLDFFSLEPGQPKVGNCKRDELLPEVLRLNAEGLSQGQIAKAVGVNQAQISRWLAGAKKDGLI